MKNKIKILKCPKCGDRRLNTGIESKQCLFCYAICKEVEEEAYTMERIGLDLLIYKVFEAIDEWYSKSKLLIDSKEEDDKLIRMWEIRRERECMINEFEDILFEYTHYGEGNPYKLNDDLFIDDKEELKENLFTFIQERPIFVDYDELDLFEPAYF